MTWDLWLLGGLTAVLVAVSGGIGLVVGLAGAGRAGTDGVRFRMVLRWWPRHHWIQVVLGTRMEPRGWAVPIHRGVVLRDSMTWRGAGVAVFRMPVTELTRRALGTSA